MSYICPSSRLLVSGSALAALLSTTMLVFPAWSQTVTPVDPSLRDVVRAAYVRAGQVKTDAEIDTLTANALPLVTFEPSRATEADIVGLVGRLGLTDASLPPPAAAVSATRILSKDPLPDYDGAADLTGKSASELGAMLSRGETTSREIVLQYMYKIQKLDHAGPALRFVTELNPELLSIADQMDARRAAATAAGETLPPLFGIPILVKNNIDTADAMRTTASSLALFGSKPTQDAALIQQLRDQGAIIMGKANMSEWANFRFGITAVSPVGGVVLNPLDPSLDASGSSSGSAVAAAMHFAPITIGTETNGSLIGPATTHHVWSLKTTPGLVSRTGVIPALETIDTPGPMANTVTDLALIMNAMKGADPADPLNAAYTGDRTTDFTQKLDGDLAGVRIGVRVTSSKIDGLVKSLASRSNATIVAFTQDDEAAAMQRSIASLSDTDLAVFYSRETKKTLPSDEADRTAILSDYRANLGGNDGTTALANFGFRQTIANNYVMRKYINRYLATRVSNPADYDSAVVRLMGDLFKRVSTDPEQYAKTLDEVAQSNNLNRSVLNGLFYILKFFPDGIAWAAAKTPEEFALSAGFASEAEFDAAIENWKRITTLVLNGARRELGVDVTATDRLDTNFTFNTSAFGSTPNLAVPVGSGTGPAELVLSADNFQDELLLRVGYALDQALSTPEFADVRALAPNPPAIGFDGQRKDIGPLLPFVLNDLDDKGRATKAHLLTTEMAPIVLRTTDPSKIPEFDGRISGNGGLIKQGAGVQLLTGTSDFSGGVQVWQGGLAIDKTEALGTSANTVTLEAGGALIATQSFALGRDVILRNGGTLGVLDDAILVEDGTVSGNGGLTKTGGGQLTLTGANSYTGGTDIQAGTVAVASEQNLGQAFGAVTIGDDAVLSATAGFTTTRPITLAGSSGLAVAAGSTLSATNTVSGIGGLSKLGAGTLSLSGENTYAGGTWLLGGVVSVSRDANLGAATGGLGFGGGQLATTASFTSARLASLVGAGGIDVAQGTVFGMSGAINGSGSLSKLGAGTLSLSGENTYAGGTFLLNGVMQVSGGAALFDAGGVDVAAPARLSLSSSETIGALSGSGAVDLGTSRLSVGADGSSSVYEGAIGGTGGLTKLGAGRLNLTGTSAYSGPTVVEGGLLSVNGVLSDSSVEVANGGTLSGSGQIDTLTVASGATLAPGNSVGTLTVVNDAVFNPGSIYRVEVAPDGRTDQLIVGGTAFLGGVQIELLRENTLDLLSESDSRFLGKSVQFITAAGGINGTFGSAVNTDFIFLGADLSYDTGGVTLTLERNDVAFDSFARSDNARVAAGALDAIAPGTSLYEEVIASNRPDVLPSFFESLTGEIHADMSSTIIGDSRFLREAALSRAGTGAAGDPSAGAVPVVGDASGATVAFFQGFGSWGSTDGRDGGSTERSTGGFFTGLDGTLDATWRIGALAGYSSASVDAANPAGSGSVESYQVALYGGRQWGGLGVRAGLGYGHNEIETSRSVTLLEGGLQPLSSDGSADMGQAFGEVGYRLGTERLSLEPFANIAYIALRTHGFAETDGSASLRADAFTQDATFSTLGLAASTRIETGSLAVTARASVGWLHSFGDATPDARLAFSAGGPAFDVKGTPIADDALILDAGASVDLSKDVSLDLAYRGQFARDAADNGFRAGLSWKF